MRGSLERLGDFLGWGGGSAVMWGAVFHADVVMS